SRTSRRSCAGSTPANASASELHGLRRFDSDKVERAGDHELRLEDQPEAEGLLWYVEHAALVVETVEVVGEADRVRRQQLRAAPLGRFANGRREVGQPLDQLLLLRREGAGRVAADPCIARAAQDRCDPRMRV